MVARTSTDTLTNKYFQAPNEVVQIVPSGFNGYTWYIGNGSIAYLTNSSSFNGSIAFYWNSGPTLVNDKLSTGQSVSCVLAITNGSTAYYPNGFMIDGSSVTPKWVGGIAPSAGNASAIDVYSFTIIKTANATFTVLAGGPTKFA